MWRSVVAVFVGFLVGAALSLGTNQVLHVLHVYPPWDQPMRNPGLNMLALGYRCVFNVVGFYVIARLAPRNPMRHVWIGCRRRLGLELGRGDRRDESGSRSALVPDLARAFDVALRLGCGCSVPPRRARPLTTS